MIVLPPKPSARDGNGRRTERAHVELGRGALGILVVTYWCGHVYAYRRREDFAMRCPLCDKPIRELE